jgi:hypothetical protein
LRQIFIIFSLHSKETLPEFRLLMNKNEIQIEGITAPLLFPPNNLLFQPKPLNLEHNYYNPRFEESADKRTLYIRDKNADNGSPKEKGWKIAKRQLLRRPGNWLSYGFDKTCASVWSERHAVTQLTAEELIKMTDDLKQKEINEIELYRNASVKRQLLRFEICFEIYFQFNFKTFSLF